MTTTQRVSYSVQRRFIAPEPIIEEGLSRANAVQGLTRYGDTWLSTNIERGDWADRCISLTRDENDPDIAIITVSATRLVNGKKIRSDLTATENLMFQGQTEAAADFLVREIQAFAGEEGYLLLSTFAEDSLPLSIEQAARAIPYLTNGVEQISPTSFVFDESRPDGIWIQGEVHLVAEGERTRVSIAIWGIAESAGAFEAEDVFAVNATVHKRYQEGLHTLGVQARSAGAVEPPFPC